MTKVFLSILFMEENTYCFLLPNTVEQCPNAVLC